MHVVTTAWTPGNTRSLGPSYWNCGFVVCMSATRTALYWPCSPVKIARLNNWLRPIACLFVLCKQWLGLWKVSAAACEYRLIFTINSLKDNRIELTNKLHWAKYTSNISVDKKYKTSRYMHRYRVKRSASITHRGKKNHVFKNQCQHSSIYIPVLKSFSNIEHFREFPTLS
jgi:hypothetical protein